METAHGNASAKYPGTSAAGGGTYGAPIAGAGGATTETTIARRDHRALVMRANCIGSRPRGAMMPACCFTLSCCFTL